MTDVIRVVVADDQTAIREALAAVLDLADDISVVAVAADGAEAFDAAERERPDVVLMDLRMPNVDGVEATRRISEALPEVAVVVLTTFADDDSVLAALGAGARGYLTKESGREDIARAVRAAAAGQGVLDAEVQRRLISAAARSSQVNEPAAAPVELTPREQEVLRLIAAGLSNRAIASQLFVSEATVKTHINNLFAKTGVRDRADAVRFAFVRGLTEG